MALVTSSEDAMSRKRSRLSITPSLRQAGGVWEAGSEFSEGGMRGHQRRQRSRLFLMPLLQHGAGMRGVGGAFGGSVAAVP